MQNTITVTMNETEALAVAAALESYRMSVPYLLTQATSPIDFLGILGIVPQVASVLDRIDTTMQAAGMPVPDFVSPLPEVPDTPEGL